MKHEFYLVQCNNKNFTHIKPKQNLSYNRPLYAQAGTKVAFQIVYSCSSPKLCDNNTQVYCYDIKTDFSFKAYDVELVPSEFPCFANVDMDYIAKIPTLYPDLLLEKSDNKIKAIVNQYRCVYVELDIPKDTPNGEYDIDIYIYKDKELNLKKELNRDNLKHCKYLCSRICVAGSVENTDTLLHTEWLYGDCIANYYNIEVYSQQYWTYLEYFIRSARQEALVNMMLVPIFSPPLDVLHKGRRTNTQLIDIYKQKDGFSFCFKKLHRYLDLLKKYDIKYIEISHLFSQWGAKYTPCVYYIDKNKEQKDLLFWEDADNEIYIQLLNSLIPQLKQELIKSGYSLENVYFHISDEPTKKDLKTYKKARDIVQNLLQDCNIIDALSNIDFYNKGYVTEPICAIDHIDPFLQKKVDKLWAYYCCVQSVDVCNRFFAMPFNRTRMMGILLYYFNIKGFLHWGFNFYNTQYSIKAIDPYKVTDAGRAFPSGDSYLVYPSENMPHPSLRSKAVYYSFQDYYKLKSLEKIIGRDECINMIDKLVGKKALSFKCYPRKQDFFEHFDKEVYTRFQINN